MYIDIMLFLLLETFLALNDYKDNTIKRFHHHFSPKNLNIRLLLCFSPIPAIIDDQSQS